MDNNSNEFSQSKYPALSTCLVVDSRLGSRHAIVKDIKSSDLFEQIIEAVSLADALLILEKGGVDACFMGPSLSAPALSAFIEQAKRLTTTEDCAFISIIGNDSPEAKKFKNSGIHAFIPRPYSKKTFTELTIEAVISANADGIWAGISLKSLAQGFTVLDKKKDAGALLAAAAMRKTSAGLKRIVADYHQHLLGLDPYGEPSAQAWKMLDDLRQEALANFQGHPDIESFSQFLRSILGEWFVDLAQTNDRIALENMKRKIMAYRS